MCPTSLGPEAIYGTTIIQVVHLIYLIFPMVHTAWPAVVGGEV